jgi:hypothetical protein
LLGAPRHRCDDVPVAGTPTEIGRQYVEQILVGDIGFALQHARCEHQKPRRAEAALHPVVRDERALQRRQIGSRGEAFDRADRKVLRLHREHQASANGFTIDENRAGAADAVLATHKRAGQAAIVADHVEQRAPGLDAQPIFASVDFERYVDGPAHAHAPGMQQARASAR